MRHQQHQVEPGRDVPRPGGDGCWGVVHQGAPGHQVTRLPVGRFPAASADVPGGSVGARAASPPRHMASTGGSVSGPAAHLQRGLVDQHPEPVGRVAPRAGGPRPATGVTGGWYTRSTTHLAGSSSAGSIGHSGGPPRRLAPMPSGVALTTRSHRAASAGRPTLPDRAGQGGGRAPRSGRPVDHHHLGGPGVGQGRDHRPGRPAGPDHQAAPARPGRSRSPAAQRGHQSGTVGVVTPRRTRRPGPRS